MTAIKAGVLLGASFAVGAALGIGVLYVVAYNVVRLLAWMQLKRAQREFRARTESPDAP